ncbi:MAG: Gfo/Idh/MocA family oxidoreductase [Pirellulales bacterium]
MTTHDGERLATRSWERIEIQSGDESPHSIAVPQSGTSDVPTQSMGTRAGRVGTRRSFLGRALGSGAGLLILPSAKTAFGYQANARLNLAVVGVGGYCAATAFLPGVHQLNLNIVALCDVDEKRLAQPYKLWDERAQSWPSSSNRTEREAADRYRRLVKDKPKFFPDFRRMLDEMDDQIDAVVCATPDHSHAVISAAALRAGKHILCEKPLTITVGEARALRELSAERKLATSMGNQGTQSPQFRRAVELIREGAIGPVEEVHVWFSRGGRDHREPPLGSEPVREGLYWDLWLGPVAWRPYHPRWIARTHWRDTSAGELGNFGPHTANMAFMGLNIADLWKAKASDQSREPIRVEARFSNLNRLSFPRWEVIHWKVPARGKLPPVTITWHHGPTPDLSPGSRELIEGLVRKRGLPVEALRKDVGALIVGSEGVIATTSHNTEFVMLPDEKFRHVEKKEPQTIRPSRGHYNDWVLACQGGETPLADFGYSATLNEFLMLGTVATQFDAELKYDPIAGKIVNHEEADRALSYQYREGWKL